MVPVDDADNVYRRNYKKSDIYKLFGWRHRVANGELIGTLSDETSIKKILQK